ncbi:unnamed protein product [Closterium sp. Naga37s-1]|nr:unnamed protein product [Closterium sp. Naga37s-1]
MPPFSTRSSLLFIFDLSRVQREGRGGRLSRLQEYPHPTPLLLSHPTHSCPLDLSRVQMRAGGGHDDVSLKTADERGAYGTSLKTADERGAYGTCESQCKEHLHPTPLLLSHHTLVSPRSLESAEGGRDSRVQRGAGGTCALTERVSSTLKSAEGGARGTYLSIKSAGGGARGTTLKSAEGGVRGTTLKSAEGGVRGTCAQCREQLKELQEWFAGVEASKLGDAGSEGQQEEGGRGRGGSTTDVSPIIPAPLTLIRPSFPPLLA